MLRLPLAVRFRPLQLARDYLYARLLSMGSQLARSYKWTGRTRGKGEMVPALVLLRGKVSPRAKGRQWLARI